MTRIDVGDKAPGFTLAGTGGSTHTLSEHRGRWVVLAFYPGDFTPVCTRQFCSYRDAADRLDTLGVTVFGISPQSVESHDRFTERYKLTVPLLSDPDKAVCTAYGVLAMTRVRRSVFILDPQQVIRYRHSAILGISYPDVDHLSGSLARARAAFAA